MEPSFEHNWATNLREDASIMYMATKTPINMKQKKKKEPIGQNKLYDLSTPLWDAYHKKVRKTVRFPRYYKTAANW